MPLKGQIFIYVLKRVQFCTFIEKGNFTTKAAKA